MSSYLAFRYVEDNEKLFYNGLYHNRMQLIPKQKRKPVKTAMEIDSELEQVFSSVRGERLGILLSGGMDSAILASYMSGCDAYTFRFLGGNFQSEELRRAMHYAENYNLCLHYVDIDWNVVERNIDPLMRSKGSPVHSIEPQIMEGALQAKADGIERMIIGDGSDYIFGGMDQLLSQDWSFDAFMRRYMFIDPFDVLMEPISMQHVFEQYRQDKKINFLKFIEEIATEESYGSYFNAFRTAQISYTDPYEKLQLAEPLNLLRIRHGESKYLIRELFMMKYPGIPVPEKVPMPRPVDIYFKDWKGPVRKEFRSDLDMSKFTGNQKWQLWCLERFLNMMEPEAAYGNAQ